MYESALNVNMQDWSLAEINSYVAMIANESNKNKDEEKTKSNMTDSDWRDFLSFSASDEDWEL